MNAMFSVLYESAQGWATVMGRASLYGGIAIALAWLACRCFPRLPTRWQCRLWRLAFLKLALCLFFAGRLDLPLLPSSFGNIAPGLAASSPTETTGVMHSDHVVIVVPGESNTPWFESCDENAASAASTSRTAAISAGGAVAMILSVLWATVVLGLGGLMVARLVAARRWRRECVLIKDPEILTISEQLAHQFRLVQPPLLFRADFCHSPVVFGALRTSIVLPSSLVDKMTPVELRFVLAHEMAHIRRGDLLGNWFVSIMSGLFFFHPLAWLACRETRLSQETACDELAVGRLGGSVADYGNLIVELAARCRQPAAPIVAVGVVESFQNSLKRRIRAIKDFGTESRGMVAVSWFLAAVAVLGLLPWHVVAQETPDGREVARQTKKTKGTAAELALLASDKSGDYTVAVDRVRFEPNRLTTSQWTGFPMAPRARSQDSSWKEWSSDDSKQSTRQEGNTRVRTGVATSAGGMAGGGGGGMGGGFGVSYTRPNLVLDVKVEPSKSRQGKFLLCEVNGKVRATDDLGNELESPGFPAARRIRMEGVDYPRGSGRTAIHLYRPGASAKASYLRSLEGELLVAEAKQSDFVLQGRELARGALKKDKNNTVRLVGFENTTEGVNVALAVSGAPLKNPRDPFERMQRMMTSQSRLNVTLEDTEGRTHEAARTRSGSEGSSGFRSGGSVGGTTWGSSGGSGGASWGPGGIPRTAGDSDGFSWSSGSGPDGATNEYHFNPLPDGVKVKAIRCTITDRVDEPTAVPFHLKDIRLPDKADGR